MRDLKDETQLLEGSKQLLKSCKCRWVSEKSRKVQLSDTKEKKLQLQASDRGTRGLRKLVGEGDDPSGRAALPKSWPRADAWWQSLIDEHSRADAWLTISFWWVDRGETILMVDSSAGDEVVRKSSWR